MRRMMRVVLAVLLLAGGPGKAFADSISGKVTNPKKCSGVQVLLRKGSGFNKPYAPKVFPAKYSAATGAFRAENLPEGRYDLRLLVPGGWVDTVDMRLEEAEGGDPFNEEDEKAIREFIANYPQSFADIFRPIFMRGNARCAKVLVEKIRARGFHSGKGGEIIWRVEVWAFEKHTGAWVRGRRSMEVVSRLRVFAVDSKHHRRGSQVHTTAEEFKGMVWLFSPANGGLEVDAVEPVADLEVTVPELTAKWGKAAGSVQRQIEAYRKKEPPPYLLD